MDALGKLTGGIAHDFNNMLGVILGYSDLLLRKLSDDPKLENYAAQILRAGERAKILTAKLLAFSRAETARAVPTDINQLLLDGRHMLEKTLTPRIVLILELADEIWPVWLDHAGLEDAILNMSINAMHAIAENGTLTLATCNVHLEEAEQLQMNIKSGDYVLMTITDSGSGMDQETRQRIFDPFFSTKGELGTGLGMSQVYGFVQQFGGDIHIDSEPGRGTSIAIYLPRYLQTDHLPAAADELVEEQHPTGHETILVVDDEAALCELASEILIAYGYRVFSADSGKLALEILAREPIDLLLSDVIMPGMDGYQLAEVVVRDYPQVKIQMVSGFSDNQHQGVSTNVKLHQHRLRKPYSTELLLQQIRARLDESELSSELELIQPIEWSEEIGTGIGAVDADHQILLSLFNRCVDLVSGNAQNDEVGAILGELMDYADYHFRREEVIMRECGYPELQSHKQAHQQLLDDAMQRVKAFGLGELSVTALLQFCHRWLTDHVINTEQDRDFISHCRGKDSLISQALRESQK
jgi:hemerythrin-like metal-binding protein